MPRDPRFHWPTLPPGASGRQIVRRLNKAGADLELVVSKHLGPRVDGRLAVSEYSDDLAAMVDAIGADDQTILLRPGDAPVLAASLALPSNIRLEGLGGLIDLATYTLTLNGPIKAEGQLFDVSGGGTLSFQFPQQIDPRWWGAAATAAPTSHTFAQGVYFMATNPSAGGSIGYVCTTGGSPGTWKTFGSISP